MRSRRHCRFKGNSACGSPFCGKPPRGASHPAALATRGAGDRRELRAPHEYNPPIARLEHSGGRIEGRSAIIEHETERLRLVAWHERHVAPFAAMNADPEVMRHFPRTLSEAETREAIATWGSQFTEKGWGNWAAELKESGEFIGFIGLSVPRRQLPFSPCVEVGWRLARRFWGNGYATEGARASLEVAFRQLRLAEVVSFTALANTRSRAVMERIGMCDTGRDFDHPAVPEGSPLRRHCLYAITRERWDLNPA